MAVSEGPVSFIKLTEGFLTVDAFTALERGVAFGDLAADLIPTPPF